MYIVRKTFITVRIEENDRSNLRKRRSPRRYGIGGLLTALIVLAFGYTFGQTPTSLKEVGPKVGQEIPAFKAMDQFGRQQSLASLIGPKGLVLLFVRSADW